MKKNVLLTFLTLTCLSASSKEQTVSLKVPTMNCAICPITVKRALSEIAGVTKVEVNDEQKQAVVTFDDTRTNPIKLMEVTTHAGYPSIIISGEKND